MMMLSSKPNAQTPIDVTRDWDFATTFEGQALVFMRDHLWRKYCRDSTEREDLKKATDYVVETPGRAQIAMRIRRIENCGKRRDFTLRLTRPSGRKTEVAKIAEGHSDFYCYCWVDTERNRLDEYIIVDMKKFLQSGLLETPDGTRANRDGSATFAFWDWRTLQDVQCILEGVKYPWGPISYRIDTSYVPPKSENN